MKCGSFLAEQAPARRSRKVVTVLFSDVTGFTPLSERTDSEALHAVMERYTQAMRAVIERHEGRVERFIGDAVMAIFGLPAVREDDALRAVRAAVEIGGALEAVNAEIPPGLEIELSASTGINSGEIYIEEDLVTGKQVGELVGDAINVAARLESAAEPGQVLLGERTFKLTRKSLAAERLELTLKGKSGKVTAYRLSELAPASAGPDRRLRARTVGRGEEAAALRSAFAQAVAEKRCVLATVSGLAGKGKSRLIADAVQSFAGRARVLSGRCLPYGEATIYWPLAEITCQAAHIKQDEEPDAAIAAIAHLLSEDPDPAQLATVQRLAGAFGLGPLAGAAEEIAPDVVTLMRALTSDGPLVAVIEDIHWAAPGLLSALEHLASRLGDAPLLLICSARPELSEKRPDWPGEAPAALSVALGPLSDDDCAALIGELLEASQAADELLAPVLAVAGGNPLVVEEVLAMLIDEGTLTQGTEGWRLERELEEIRIPATIEAILGARLDRLSEPEREVIEAAAVVGKDFDLAEVRALAELKGHSLAEQIGALLDKQLIEIAVGSLSDYRFHHILVRDAAYAATPKRRRAELHERLGEHLERSPAGQREGTYGEIIGEHLERACLFRRELGADDEEVRELAHHAGILLAQSGARAQGLSDFLAGGRVYERGRAVLAADDPLRATLSLGLAEVKCDIGLLEEAQLAVTEAIALSDQLGLTEVQPRAAIILGLIEVLCGQRSGEDALPSLSRLAGELVQTGDSRGAWAWMACCGIAGLAALFTEAVNASEQAIALATRSFRDQLPYCLVGYCVAMARGPLAVEEATERCEAAHARVQQDTLHAAMMECQLAYLRGMSGDIIGARDRYEAALTACERYGAHRYRGAYLFDWGTCELLVGDFRRAETCFRRAGDLMADLDEMFSLEAASLHARALARLGQHAAALDEAEQASERMRTPDLEAQVWWRIAAALACSGMDKVDRAEKVAREALALARPTQAPHLLGDTLACLGEVLLHRESSEADPVLREAIAVYEAKGIRPGAESVRQLLMSGAAGVTIR